MRLGRLPPRTGDLRADAISQLRWGTHGAGLSVEKIVVMDAVLALPRIAEALAGTDPSAAPRTAFDALVAAARALGDSPHPRMLRNALAIDYDGAGKDLTARRTELVRRHNEAAREPRDRLPESARQLYAIEQRMIEALVTELGAPGSPVPVPPTPGPPVATAMPVPRELPAATASFSGRSDALEWLDRSLAAAPGDAPTVLVVHGQPGVGKTALALRWAHRNAADFPDGQVWLDLRGHSRDGAPLTPAAALRHVLQSLGVPPDALSDDAGHLAGHYRSVTAGKRLLLVLDNAASTDQVSPLVPGEPGCVVLATSRNALPGLAVRHGARALTLDAMSPAEAATLLATLVGERAATEPAAVAELATLCGYLPLALRIVAAKLQDESQGTVAGMVGRLRAADRLTTLGFGDGGEVAVRAAFELSYSSLGADEQRAFRLLGLVPGTSVEADAVAPLLDTDPPTARRLAGRLVSAHLVGERAFDRYDLHDLLREYAGELCHAVDGDGVQHAAEARLLAHYVRRAIAATATVHPRSLRLPGDEPEGPAVTPFADRAAAVAWLVTEQPNVAAAVVHAAAHGHVTAAWQLAYGMRGWFLVQPNGVDWLALGQAGLDAARDDGHLYAVSAMHGLLGRAHRHLGDLDAAAVHVRAALAASGTAGWQAGEVIAHCTLGGIRQDQARLDDAIGHYGAAYAIDRHLADGAGATHLANIGSARFQQGAFADAEEQSTAALELQRRTGDERGTAVTLGQRAAVRQQLGRPDDAVADLDAVLRISRRLGLPEIEAEALALLATICAGRGDHGTARRYAVQARRRARALDDARLGALCADAVGTVALRAGRVVTATRMFREALTLATSSGHRYGMVAALVGAANAEVAAGAPDRAWVRADEALDAARAAGFRALEGYALTALGRAQYALGDRDGAELAYRDAVEVFRGCGCRAGEAEAASLLAPSA